MGENDKTRGQAPKFDSKNKEINQCYDVILNYITDAELENSTDDVVFVICACACSIDKSCFIVMNVEIE